MTSHTVTAALGSAIGLLVGLILGVLVGAVARGEMGRAGRCC